MSGTLEETKGNILSSPAQWVIVQVPSEPLSKGSFTHSCSTSGVQGKLNPRNLEASGSCACPKHTQGFVKL